MGKTAEEKMKMEKLLVDSLNEIKQEENQK
jgi:hypothetical protein